MDGKEVKGRLLKVDFDVNQKPKNSYKFNTNQEKNKLYNKTTIKEINNKRQRKEKEKKKMAHTKANSRVWLSICATIIWVFSNN